MTKVMKSRTNLLIASSLMLFYAQPRAQTLIYSLSYSETPTSFRARFPNGAIGAPINEKLAMLRNYRKTEIYSVSMIDGKRSLLFSDEGMNFEIRPTDPAVGAGKAYVPGVEREWRTTPNPGVYSDPPAIYEISLDGSKRFRRLFETRPNQNAILLNRQAKKAVFEALLNEKYVVFVYDVPAWKLLRSWELTKLSQAHCPDCLPMSYGWLTTGDRLFFNLDLGAESDGDESKNHNLPGTCIVSEEGADLGGISPETGRLQLPGYVHPNYVNRFLIGQLPDGSYLFQDYAAKKGAPLAELQRFLVVSNAETKLQKQLPQKFRARSYYLSPSGKYLAYIEERQIPNYRTELHLWGRDLQSGEEKELFAAPPPNPPASPEPNVVLTVLGWANND
jgi:hypothetical protein